jgi:general secretion pathway protein N
MQQVYKQQVHKKVNSYMISPAVVLPQLNASKKFWIMLGVIVWLYVVISNLPAIWGAYVLTRSGDLAMSGVSGTLWSGRASLVSVKIKGADHSLGQLTWRLNVLSIFTLKPCALITTQMDNQQFDGTVCSRGKTGVSVKNANASFPAVLVQPLLPLAIDGQLALTLEKLEIENSQLIGVRGKASWMNAKIYNGSNWMALGGLGADLVDDGKKGLTAHIMDVSSPLHLDLVTTLPFPAGGSVKGNFSLPEPYFRELNASAWLSMFAVPQPNDAQGNLAYLVDLNF